jgi:hypothetical protein
MLEPELNDKQNHYLTRLGIPSEVQALFYGTYKADHQLGGIYFEYSEGVIEHYNFGFHRVPSVPTFWRAGVLETNIITDIIIASSAMDIITFVSKKINTYSNNSNILFLASGTRLHNSHLALIKNFSTIKITMIFENSFLGSVSDIKVAAALLDQPIIFKVFQDTTTIKFKDKTFEFSTETLSLNSFRKAFKVRTPKLRTQKSKSINFLQDHLNNIFYKP